MFPSPAMNIIRLPCSVSPSRGGVAQIQLVILCRDLTLRMLAVGVTGRLLQGKEERRLTPLLRT
jgi:hypothetical protein